MTTGEKRILGLREGGTENSVVCGSLLDDIIERGLRSDIERLFVLDGSKALSKAVKEKFGDKSEIQRCQLHKKRNVESHLPESQRSWVIQKMNLAYSEFEYKEAKQRLEKLAKDLEYQYPSAANSIMEGLEETLTMHRLKVPGTLRVTLSTTNPAESLMSMLRGFAGRVKKWESGNQVLRWMACGCITIEPKLRRIKGYKQLPFLISSLAKISSNEKSGIAI
jgi:transposase-like protein